MRRPTTLSTKVKYRSVENTGSERRMECATTVLGVDITSMQFNTDFVCSFCVVFVHDGIE